MSRAKTLDYLKSISGNDKPLFFILGPCAIENEAHSLKVAQFLKALSEKLKFHLIFKSSFDKANRTSASGYRSVGLQEGGRILAKVRDRFDVPITTDVHEAWQVEKLAFADVLQIPAFLSRQTDLLISAGRSGKIVNIKKGQMVAPGVMKHAVDKVLSTGNNQVWLCERGYAFGYGDLVVDFRNFQAMKSFDVPVIYDATHSVQKPSALGSSSGGARENVAQLAIAAVSQGIAGVFMEVHQEPEQALCDGPNSVRLSHLEELIKYLIDLDGWVKSRKSPVVF